MNDPLLGQSPTGGLIYRYRPAQDPEGPAVIFLHGLHGDERAMWVLERALPPSGTLIAPRGIYPLPGGGFGWLPPEFKGWPHLMDFRPAVHALKTLIADLTSSEEIDHRRLVLMGFSQGAALGFAYAMLGEGPIALISAAGFLPQGELEHLAGLPVFWGHGTQDAMVSIDSARRAVDALRVAGTHTAFCEAEIGHKLGLECLRGLKTWFRKHVHPSPRTPS